MSPEGGSFVQDGVSDPTRCSAFPVYQPIRPPAVTRRQRSRCRASQPEATSQVEVEWKSDQEVPDSHDERLARVRRQLQDGSFQQSGPAQVIAMDADDSSDGSGFHKEQWIPERPRRGFPPAAVHQGFRNLDCVDLVNVFEVRLLVMNTITAFLQGAYKNALKASLQEIRRGQERRNRSVEIRGWKLFLVLPRILLHNPQGVGSFQRSSSTKSRQVCEKALGSIVRDFS